MTRLVTKHFEFWNSHINHLSWCLPDYTILKTQIASKFIIKTTMWGSSEMHTTVGFSYWPNICLDFCLVHTDANFLVWSFSGAWQSLQLIILTGGRKVLVLLPISGIWKWDQQTPQGKKSFPHTYNSVALLASRSLSFSPFLFVFFWVVKKLRKTDPNQTDRQIEREWERDSGIICLAVAEEERHHLLFCCAVWVGCCNSSCFGLVRVPVRARKYRGFAAGREE